ncbi:enoyl-CoA hydratase domain-containing protein 3, mitochondrial-like isoform X3 [Diachasmimorpha longicaudata]
MMKILLWNLTRDVESESLRSIVISAAPGKVFSAGHNLKELASSTGSEHHKEVFQTAAALMQTIATAPVPVIAAVDGLAAAAGCQLVSACDIVICTEKSSFSTPGANFGIFCSTPGIPLVRNVPRKVAAHMLFTGLPISAHEAYNAGLVSKVVNNDQLGCCKMAAVPQGAFAVRKVRETHQRNVLFVKMTKKEGDDRDCRGGGFKKNLTEGRELTPLKYNSKLMNSIWGLYNRYSVHNFKKNTDPEGNNETTVFTAAWGSFFEGDTSAAGTSAEVVGNAAVKH